MSSLFKWNLDKSTDEKRSILRYVIMFLLGQICSFFLALAGVCITHLKKYNIQVPFIINLTPYLFINIITTPYAIYHVFYKQNRQEIIAYFKDHGYVYLLIAFFEVCSLWASTTAYFLTNMVSVQSLSTFSVLTAMLVSRYLFNFRYIFTHYFGILICLIGFVLMIVADYMADLRTDIQTEPLNRTFIFSSKVDILCGDFLAIIAAICFGVSITLQESIVRKDGSFISLGIFSFILSTLLVPFILGFELNRIQDILSFANNGTYPITVIIAYTSYAIILIIFVLLFNAFLNNGNSIMLVLSLMTTNFYSLILAVAIFKEKFTPIYGLGFVIVIFGSIVFSLLGPTVIEKDGKKSIYKS